VAGWNEFRDDGKFVVEFPAPPTSAERTDETLVGPLVAHSYTARDGAGAEYVVHYSDLPSSASYENLPGGPTPDVSGLEARGFAVRKVTPNTVCGYPGSRVEGAFDGRVASDVQFVWVGRRQYLLIRVSGGGDGGGDGRFFSSFRVLSK
jgi:hypothetical protein